MAVKAVKVFKPKVEYLNHPLGKDTVKFKTLLGGVAEVRLLNWCK